MNANKLIAFVISVIGLSIMAYYVSRYWERGKAGEKLI